MSRLSTCFKDGLQADESSKTTVAKKEKERLRQLKKRKKEELQRFMKQQNDAIDADAVRITLSPVSCSQLVTGMYEI